MKKFITILLVAVLLASGVYASWYLYNQRTEDKSAQESNIETTNEIENNTQTIDDEYLTIKEWGVRFKLSAGLQDAKYKLSDDGKTVYLSTQKLEKISGCERGESLALQRAKENEAIGPSDVQTIKEDNPSALIHIEDYYYLYTAAPFMCSQNTNEQEFLKGLRESFGEDVRKLEPAS